MPTLRNLKRNQKGVMARALQRTQRRMRTKSPMKILENRHHLMTSRIHHHQGGPRARRAAVDRQEGVEDHLGHPAAMGTHRVTPHKADRDPTTPLPREADHQEEVTEVDLHRAVARQRNLKQTLVLGWHLLDTLHGRQSQIFLTKTAPESP